MKKRISQYQYEPLVTPTKWNGEEQRFSQRLTQIIDDLYAKFSSLKTNSGGSSSEGEVSGLDELNSKIQSVSETVQDQQTDISGLQSSVSALELADQSHSSAISTNQQAIVGIDQRVTALENTEDPELDELRSSIESVSNTVESHQADITDLQNSAKALSSADQAHDSAIAENASAIASNQQSIEGIDQRVIALEETDVPSVDKDEIQAAVLKAQYPVGSCYTTSTNTNPAGVLGFGTWELIDKVFSSLYSQSDFFTFDTTNVSAAVLNMRRSGHSARLRMNLTLLTALGESNVVLGTVNYSAVGFSSLGTTMTTAGFSDGGNGFSAATINNNTGVFTHIERATVSSGGSIAAGQQVQYDFVLTGNVELMLDESCDQFVWKRTA